MSHVLYETGDFGAPRQIKDSNGEVVRGLCKVCGRAEAELELGCTTRAEANRYRDHSELHNATPGCDGEVIAEWSGVKCNKCKGWFCY